MIKIWDNRNVTRLDSIILLYIYINTYIHTRTYAHKFQNNYCLPKGNHFSTDKELLQGKVSLKVTHISDDKQPGWWDVCLCVYTQGHGFTQVGWGAILSISMANSTMSWARETVRMTQEILFCSDWTRAHYFLCATIYDQGSNMFLAWNNVISRIVNQVRKE